MLGTDGRLYDSDFDFDGDGKLNAYEYSVMDDLVSDMKTHAQVMRLN